jgi:hypothetical protein
MKVLNIKIYLILFVIFLTSGCRKNVSINQKQYILFQVEYINYALGYEHSGFFIDKDGNILSYRNPQVWIYPDNDLMLNSSQVHENIKSCSMTGKRIPPDELKKYAGYIKNISLSKVTAKKNVAAEAGSREYICYLYSENSETYKGYLIKMEGNFTCENLNFYSRKVSSWLKSINDSIGK